MFAKADSKCKQAMNVIKALRERKLDLIILVRKKSCSNFEEGCMIKHELN